MLKRIITRRCQLILYNRHLNYITEAFARHFDPMLADLFCDEITIRPCDVTHDVRHQEIILGS